MKLFLGFAISLSINRFIFFSTAYMKPSLPAAIISVINIWFFFWHFLILLIWRCFWRIKILLLLFCIKNFIINVKIGKKRWNFHKKIKKAILIIVVICFKWYNKKQSHVKINWNLFFSKGETLRKLKIPTFLSLGFCLYFKLLRN